MFKLLLLLSSSHLCLGAPLEGFGDATAEEIAQIRAGTYLEMFDENPTYNFNYKVADGEEQTYVAMEESRADNIVTGTYSYVDPLGSLIRVTYTAGPMGYSENREVQEGFVKITAKPVKTQVSSSSGSVNGLRPGSSSAFGTSGSSSSGTSSTSFGTTSGTSSTFGSSTESSSSAISSSTLGSSAGSSSSSLQSDLVSSVVSQIQPLISQTVTSAVAGQQISGSSSSSGSPFSSGSSSSSGSTSSSGSSSLSQSDLIATILSQIQPLISQTVSSAIAGSSSSSSPGSTSTISSSRPSSQSSIVSQAVSQIQPIISQTVSSTVSGAPTTAGAPVQDTLGGLFGTGGDFNVRINTPKFGIEY